MDARERLRRYLEERRDLGESELVLDSMSVESVLRTIGALKSGTAGDVSARTERDAHSPTDNGWRHALAEAPVPVGERIPLLPTIEHDDMATNASTGAVDRLESIEAIASAVEKCTRCPLYQTATHGVPGEGPLDAQLVCVGEAPGANEDLSGRPFVGAAGNLLTKILAAVDLAREDVFITNVVKHRPPGNRNPTPAEIAACSPYLVRQLELIKPKVIVAFGTFAAQTLLDTKTPIGKLRGEAHRYQGIPLVVTYHPAALLRNSAWKRPTWDDVKLARRILDSAIGA